MRSQDEDAAAAAAAAAEEQAATAAEHVPRDDRRSLEESDNTDVIYLGTSLRGTSIQTFVWDPVGPSTPTAAPPAVAQESDVDLDKLLVQIGDARKPSTSAPPPPPLPPPPLLGKRGRSPSPELVLSPELFDEVGMLNGMFLVPCMNLDAPPATFELCVAGSPDWRVQLAFPSDYPAALPRVIQVDYKNGIKMFKLTRDILRSDAFQDARPCLERLMRELVDALTGKLGHVQWKFAPSTAARSASAPPPAPAAAALGRSSRPYAKNHSFPTIEEMWDHMHGLRAASLEYPPKLPVFSRRDGFNTAFVTLSLPLWRLSEKRASGD